MDAGTERQLRCWVTLYNPPRGIIQDEDNCSRENFEFLFKKIDTGVHFSYLKAFNVARICFTSHAKASDAVNALDGYLFGEEKLKLKYGPDYIQIGPSTLEVPQLEKLLLISPPHTPPVDWKQCREEKPSGSMMEELTQALTLSANPLEPINLHPGCDKTPSILLQAPTEENEELKPHIKINVLPREVVYTAMPPY